MNNYLLKMDKPTRWWGAMWREAIPTGNGHIGAAVYGAVYDETIMITHEDLWWKSRTPALPDVSNYLKTERQHLMKDNPEEARWPICNALTKSGYNPQLAAPLPLCDLKIRTKPNHTFSKYKRTLDMSTGVVNVSFNDDKISYERDVFVSRADNVVVCRIQTKTSDTFKVRVSLDFHDLEDAKTKADNIDLSSVTDLDTYLPQNMHQVISDDYIHFSATNDDGTQFGAVAKVFAKKIESEETHLWLTSDDEILILIKTYVKSDFNNQDLILKNELNKIFPDYDVLLDRHTDIHTSLMTKTSFELYGEDEDASNDIISNEVLLTRSYTDETPISLLEKLWLFGRYLLISSTDNYGQPCHLYGLWCGEYQGMWAFNMLNENVEMIYWQALNGNMPNVMLSLFDYYESKMQDFRINAKHLYDCRGIFIPAATTPESGLLKLILPHILHWTGGAGWLSQHYFDYYDYTGDIIFLRNRAYPFMKEAILFYEDFLVIDENNYYSTIPSNSPENTPGNFSKLNDLYESGKTMETTVNATMDFAILKELLHNLIKTEELLDINDGQSEKWTAMLAKIPPYQLNDDKTLKEWMYPLYEDNHHHRHLSHLYPVFPGTEITKEAEPKLFSACTNTLIKRMSIGLKEQSGWSIAHLANCFSRVGMGNESLICLESLTRCSVLDNLYTTHNDWRSMGTTVDFPWAPIQIDANMGITNAMNEMVLRSIKNSIYILPALPGKWKKGKVTNLLARGPVEVSIDWDLQEKLINVTLTPLHKNQTVTLILPDIVKSCTTQNLDKQKIKNLRLFAHEKTRLVFNL